MNIIPGTTSLALLLLSRGCVSVAAAAIPHLEGATPAANPEDHYAYDVNSQRVNAADAPSGTPAMTMLEAPDIAAAAAGYTYYLRINATLPVDEAQMDRCVEWRFNSNGENFTWYGLRIQLPPDASTGSGGYYTDVTRATRGLGWAQNYDTPPATILDYNLTTTDAQPTVRINFNDIPVWDTYTFDFVDTNGGSVAADGSSYQEFKKELRGAISCFADAATEEGDDSDFKQVRGRIILMPVTPTLTISLQRFMRPPPPPTPSPPSSAANVLGQRLLAPIVLVAASLLPAML